MDRDPVAERSEELRHLVELWEKANAPKSRKWLEEMIRKVLDSIEIDTSPARTIADNIRELTKK